MRIDLLKRWLKMFPYGYCDGINFQTCRANENDCPYCMSDVHCSDGNAAIEYYREMLRYRKMKPHKARKIAVMFAETLPSIMRALDTEITAELKKRAKRISEKEGIPMKKPELTIIYNQKSNTLTFEVPESEVDPRFLEYFKETHGIPADAKCIFEPEKPVEGGV